MMKVEKNLVTSCIEIDMGRGPVDEATIDFTLKAVKKDIIDYLKKHNAFKVQ